MTRHTTLLAMAAVIAAAAALPTARAQGPAPTEATTGTGEKILIYPDGRWEYADPAKRTAKPPSAPLPPTAAGGTATVAAACPPGSQGLLSLGRCIPPGDKDYNRGSLSGKGR